MQIILVLQVGNFAVCLFSFQDLEKKCNETFVLAHECVALFLFSNNKIGIIHFIQKGRFFFFFGSFL